MTETIPRPGAAGSGSLRAPEAKTQAAWSGRLVAMHGMAEPGWTKASYAALAHEGFMRNPVVHRCVRMVAEAVAAIPLLMRDGATELSEHPALDLLGRPNAAQTGAVFFETLVGHLLLSGNAYVELSAPMHGRRAMHLLRPDRVSVETGDDGWVEAFVYQAGNGKRMIPIEGNGKPAPILHLAQFHPLADHEGFAPLAAALMAIDIHNAAGRWNKALLDNAARPSGALVYAPGDHSGLTDEQFDRLKRELEDGYSGAGNAGKPLLLEGGLDWKAMALTPKDMDFVEARNGASRDIALAFGVPPMLLGIPGDNTYANYQEANRAFYRLTVLPLMMRITDAMSHWLGEHFSARLRIDADLDQVTGLAAERDALWQRLQAAGFLSDDEKRIAVGYAPKRSEETQ